MLLILVNVLIKPAYIFLIEIPVQNHVGNESYGLYFAFLNLAYIFQLFSDLGLQNYTYTELPRNKSRLDEITSNILATRGLLALLFLAVLSVAGALLGYWEADAKLFALVMVNVLLVSTIGYIRANIAGLGMYFNDSLYSVVDKIVMLITLSIMLYVMDRGSFTIYSFVLAQTFSFGCAILIGFLLMRRRLRWIPPIWSSMKNLSKQALPFGILIALMFLYTRIDAIMIEKMLQDGPYEAGLYASAYRLYDAVAMISFLFATLLLPMFSEMDDNMDGRQRLYYGSLSMIFGVSVLIAIPIIVCRVWIMESLYPTANADSIGALAILMVAFIFKGSLFVTSSLLTSLRRFRVLNILFILSIALNFITNYVLIPTHGIVGASVATLAAQFFLALGCIYLVHREVSLSVRLLIYIRILGFGISVSVIFYALEHYLIISDHLWWVIGLTAAMGLTFVLMNYRLLAQLSNRLHRH